MTESAAPISAEISAMEVLINTLEPLEEDARKRVLDFVISRLRVSAPTANPTKHTGTPPHATEPAFENSTPHSAKASFSGFAELFDATQPKSNPDKALIAGYWLQVCCGSESFDGQSANKELKHLGHGLANITSAVDGLKSQKPALALQLKKSGKSQQARKLYKITVAGVKAVEGLIDA